VISSDPNHKKPKTTSLSDILLLVDFEICSGVENIVGTIFSGQNAVTPRSARSIHPARTETPTKSGDGKCDVKDDEIEWRWPNGLRGIGMSSELASSSIWSIRFCLARGLPMHLLGLASSKSSNKAVTYSKIMIRGNCLVCMI